MEVLALVLVLEQMQYPIQVVVVEEEVQEEMVAQALLLFHSHLVA
jgi:hypothetical protein